jgi:hypothetical protein
MSKRTPAAAVLVFATLVAVLALQAQSVPQRVNVPFKFNLMDKAYQPAMYYFRYDGSAEQVELLSRDKSLLTRVRVVTRLAPTPGAKNDGHVRLVFDQVGEERYLSEVWMPGIDGLLVRATSERHKHESVEGQDK